MSEKQKDIEKETPRKRKKVGLYICIAIILMLLIVAVVIVAPLIKSYHDSYENIPFITRDGEYTHPDMPTDITTIDEEEWLKHQDDPDDWEDTDDWEITDEPTEPIIIDPVDPDTDVTNPSVIDPPASESNSKQTTKKTTTNDEPAPYQPIKTDGIYKVAQKDPNILNILVIGTDTRNPTSVSGRSDVMLVVSYNKKEGSIKMVSLLRDLYVPIEGHGWNRLNTAYRYGGIALCINTINDLFGLDIQRFLIINFDGTKKIIDMCGGVDIALTDEEAAYFDPIKLDNGLYHLDGRRALIHMRNRHVKSSEGSGDFARTGRQRAVLTALYNKMVTTCTPAELYSIIQECFGLIRTNIKLNEMLDLASEIIKIGGDLNIVSDRIPQRGTYGYAMVGKKAVTTFDLAKNKKFLMNLLYGN